MKAIFHVSPDGVLHATNGLSILTLCGLHPSKSKGWLLDGGVGKVRRICTTCQTELKEVAR